MHRLNPHESGARLTRRQFVQAYFNRVGERHPYFTRQGHAMEIPGAQQILEWGKKQLSLKILFEVVDDPQDSSQYRDWLKPLNVRFFFNPGPVTSQLAPQT